MIRSIALPITNIRPIISPVNSQIGTMVPLPGSGPETIWAPIRELVRGALIARARGDVRHWPLAELAVRGGDLGPKR